MICASEFKKGIAIQIDGQPHVVETIFTQSPSARGGTTLYKVRTRNIITGYKADHSLKGDDSFVEVELEKRAVQFLYREQDKYCFMDLEDYSQFELAADTLEAQASYLLEDMELTAQLIDGTVRGILLPDTVNLKIVECDPGVKSASATARTKNATVETGLTVQVPEYLERGQLIKIDTRDGRYLSRA